MQTEREKLFGALETATSDQLFSCDDMDIPTSNYPGDKGSLQYTEEADDDDEFADFEDGDDMSMAQPIEDGDSINPSKMFANASDGEVMVGEIKENNLTENCSLEL